MNEEGTKTEDFCSESAPMNTPAIIEDDPQPMPPENIPLDSNATNSHCSEQGNIIFHPNHGD